MVIAVEPTPDDDVMLSMPAIVENCFSSGVATADAIVSGLAPGRLALTEIVGKSTFGKSLTGSDRYAVIPKTKNAIITSVVMIGRRMKISAIFMNRYLDFPMPAVMPRSACLRGSPWRPALTATARR